jgi:hypothetical protein
MALDMIDNINVSLAGGAPRAQKLRAAARAGKAGVMSTRSRPSHCGPEATGACALDGATAQLDLLFLPQNSSMRADRRWR